VNLAWSLINLGEPLEERRMLFFSDNLFDQVPLDSIRRS